MDELDLGELDFGEIYDCNIPKECCNKCNKNKKQDGIVSNHKIIAHLDDKTECERYKEFTVNLHRDGSWSFNFTNGEKLSNEQIQNYCSEITGAQALLTAQRQWRLRGRELGVWDFRYNSGAGSDGANEDNNTIYRPAGSGNYGKGPCSIQGPADLNVRPTPNQ
jgi:hypothetical protein